MPCVLRGGRVLWLCAELTFWPRCTPSHVAVSCRYTYSSVVDSPSEWQESEPPKPISGSRCKTSVIRYVSGWTTMTAMGAVYPITVGSMNFFSNSKYFYKCQTKKNADNFLIIRQIIERNPLCLPRSPWRFARSSKPLCICR